MPRAFTDDEQRRIRARLLQAARDAVPRTGLRRTQVEVLARAAGISKGAFYRFFESKEALWVALLGEEEETARAGVSRAADEPGPERLKRVFHALLDALAGSPTLLALTDPDEAAWLSRSLPAELWAHAQADDDRWFGALWARLRAEGELPPEVPDQVLSGLPRALFVLAQQRAWIGEERAEAVIALVVEALVVRLGGAQAASSAGPALRR